jgi:hypothetical protein
VEPAVSRRGWLPHLALLAVAALELAAWAARRRSIDELAALAREGDAASRIAAIVELSNRSVESARRMPGEAELLADHEPRVQELALTSVYLRHLPPAARQDRVEIVRARLAGGDVAAALRAAFVLLNQCDVRGERGLRLPHLELAWYLAACGAGEGRAPTRDEARRFLLERYPLARLDSGR